MKLYEITDVLRSLMDAMSEPPPPSDAPAELHDEWLARRRQAQAAFDDSALDLRDKLRAYVAFALELKVEREAREAHIATITANVLDKMHRQNARDEAKEAWLMETAQAVVQQFKVPLPMKFSEFTVKLQKLPLRAEVIDEQALPDEYCRLIPAKKEADKKKLLADLKQGVVIEGARLSAPACKLAVK